jgi:heptosyltransferase-2
MHIETSPTRLEPVLIRLPNWVGDVCMCLPAIARLNALGIPLAICAKPWAKDLLSGLNLQSFIPISGKFTDDLRTLRAWHGAHPTFEKALLLPDSLSSALLFKLAGFQSAGYRDDGRSLLLRWGFNPPRPRPHATKSWFHLTELALASWKYDFTTQEIPATLHLPLTATHQQLAQQAIERSGLADTEFILIAPTAVGLHKGQIKVWPHFDVLTRQLQDYGHHVVMCPPASEQAAALHAAPTAQLLPPMALGPFAALTSLAKLVICNDSGVSHLCAAANGHQLTLFGVTDPERTGPWTPNTVNLGQNGHWPAPHAVVERVQQLLSLQQ